MQRLKRTTPEAQGVSSKAVLKFLKAVNDEERQMHNFMLLKNGAVICERSWEPYSPKYRHELFSLSKSYTSIGVGIAIDEGLLTTETLLSDIFKDEFNNLGNRVDEKIRRMTIKNLLTMGTGMEYENWTGDGGINNIEGFLTAHIKNEPGSAFFYNTLATYTLSAAITRLTGQKLVDWLKPRLFEPLGIEPYWLEDERTGVSMGGFGLNIKIEDIAVFGQMLLNKGVWNGKRIVSENYIDEATEKQINNGDDPNNDWAQGYGYQFWRCIPEGVYRGDGMYGQFCVVENSTQTVIAVNSNADMGRVMKLFWELLSDMKTEKANEADFAELEKYTGFSHLKVTPNTYPTFRAEYKSAKSSDGADRFDPHIFAPDILHFDFDGEECALTTFVGQNKTPQNAFLFNPKQWTLGAANYFAPGYNYSRAATYGVWENNVFTATVWHYETPTKTVLRFTFNEDKTEVKYELKTGGPDAAFSPLYTATVI